VCAGSQKTCGVHVEDLAQLYVLGIKKSSASGVFHTTTGNDYTAKCVAICAAPFTRRVYPPKVYGVYYGMGVLCTANQAIPAHVWLGCFGIT
jgi:nucleoside-diphosphate-sugar epimerase